MEEIINKLNDFKQAVKNGLLDGTIKYTKRYKYNAATPYLDWCDIEFTIDKINFSLAVGKYNRDILCTKADTFILSYHSDILKDVFTKEEEQQFCEMVDNKPTDPLDVDEEIKFYERKLQELKHE